MTTFSTVYPRVRASTESVIHILTDIDVFLYFVFILTSMFAASVQRDGRHPPDEAFGFGQQPAIAEQW